jgi:hypothetical protein
MWRSAGRSWPRLQVPGATRSASSWLILSSAPTSFASSTRARRLRNRHRLKQPRRLLANSSPPVYKGPGGTRLEAQVGTQIAGYCIEAVIGRGGMGVVYMAQDLSLERKAALKVLAPDLSEDTKFRERFVRESRLAALLDHPNIVPIYEAREVDGQLCIAMRYVLGMNLKTS